MLLSNIRDDLIESLPFLVFWKSLNGHYLGANKKFLNFLGLEIEQLLEKSDYKSDELKEKLSYFSLGDSEVLEKKVPLTEIIKTISLANKTQVTLSTDKFPLYNQQNEIIGCLGLVKILNENYSKTQIFLEKIIDTVPNIIFWKDTNSIYLGCNTKFASLVHAIPTEVIGKSDFELDWKNDEAKLFVEGDKEVLAGKPKINVEEMILQSDGSHTIMLVSKVPIYNEKMVCIGILGVSVDITDRKKMEEDLRIAKEKAEEANYIKTELIANIGHDFAAPISDVGNIAIMFDCYSDEYPELKDLIDSLTEKAAACEKVRKATIDATSISNMELKPKKFSTVQELLLLEKEFRSVIESKNIKLIFHPLKPKKEDIIETDRSKFHAILQALISNAINFTEKGEVTVSVSKDSGWFKIQVLDTGVGIPSDKYEYIFQPFTKLSRSNKYGANFKGMGSGLYLAKIRANILGATISVVSEVGKGSVFTFSIPTHPVSNL